MLAIEMLTEPVHVHDTTVSGLSHVEDLEDGYYRLTFYSTRQSLHGGGNEYVVEVRMIASYTAIMNGIILVMKTIGKRFCDSIFKAVVGKKTVH